MTNITRTFLYNRTIKIISNIFQGGKKMNKKIVSIMAVAIFVFSSTAVFGENLTDKLKETISYDEKSFEIDFSFSYPEILEQYNYSVIRVNETNHNRIIMFDYETNYPVLPVNLSIFELPFGTKIQSIAFEHSMPEVINLSNKIAFSRAQFDSIEKIDYNPLDYKKLYSNIDQYPISMIQCHTGGGLSYSDRVTYLVLRIYPVIYHPNEDKIDFFSNINVNISYIEPEEPIIKEEEKQDLLIISPDKFADIFQPLVNFKNSNGVKTKLFTTEEIYSEKLLKGRDEQEKIKYFIKGAIERWNIKNVLLVGGRDGQKDKWNLPVRYSYVVPTEEQEYPETRFVSDVYYADIYDSEGKFSNWDSNDDNKFSVWNKTFKDEMDLYPDVYLGRLACRNKMEARTMVRKILRYERNNVKNEEWFNNILLVAGDSYVNHGQWPEGEIVKEGEIACEKSLELMPGFNPLKVYSSSEDINRKTINDEFNKGAGFAYICGHGSRVSWSTHFSDPINESSNWTTGYHVKDMVPLRNKDRLPITVVGGCHNGEFDKTIPLIIKKGFKNKGLKYFFSRFLFDGWTPNCWAWWITSKPNGGAIATIANTALGTHGDGDQDLNGVIDYLEILDGWLELRFLELYGMEKEDNLGLNHGQTMTEYLHKFLGDHAKMDVKMIQQWELFGDPSLKIGGYN